MIFTNTTFLLDNSLLANGKFSKEQKEKFEKDILPEIERLMEDSKKKLEQNGNAKDKQRLEKEYEKLKDNVEL